MKIPTLRLQLNVLRQNAPNFSAALICRKNDLSKFAIGFIFYLSWLSSSDVSFLKESYIKNKALHSVYVSHAKFGWVIAGRCNWRR